MTGASDTIGRLIVFGLAFAFISMPLWFLLIAALRREPARRAWATITLDNGRTITGTGNVAYDAALAISLNSSLSVIDRTPLKPETIALDPMTGTLDELDAAQADCDWVCAVEYPETEEGYERGCRIREAIDAARKARGLPAFDDGAVNAALERRWRRRREDEARSAKMARAFLR